MLKDLIEKYGARRFTWFSHLIIVFIFSGIYYYFLTPADFNGGEGLNNYIDYFYYTIVTHASVGYGDISPKTKKAKMIVTLHIIIAFCLIISLWL